MITSNELLSRLQHPEDGFTDRKLETVARGDIRRTVVAFANSVPEGRTAILFIGVADDGAIKGCSNTDGKQKLVRQVCEQDCYPPIQAATEIIATPAGSMLAVIIGPSSDRPHFAGRAYVRKGSESVIASPQIFDELVHSRNSRVAAILRHKNDVVSVRSIGRRLGDARPVSNSSYSEYAECRIEECNPHFVRLYNISSRDYYCEPTDHVQVLRDEHRHRTMLVIRP